ncbi:type II CAAX endopeptidase family protein [Hanstruepera marina]|uniref:type II CAAX endopeptidase family protein n=1 Tax=Hanstruepera marina TaxID=2873265 RepID=UPI001CA67140|nr:type II CAAX endopeptidase family protein [Hanstruepera marina]
MKNQLFTFFGLSFLITWSILFTIIGFGLPEIPYYIPAVYGPTLSAIILMLYYYGLDGLKVFFKQFLKKGVKWYWYPIVIFSFGIIFLIAKILWFFATGEEVTTTPYSMKWLLMVFVMQILIAGFGEEFGWRGFALERMQIIYSPLKASVILGFVHLLWHLPTYFLGNGMHNVPIFWALLYVIPVTIIWTWIFNKTKRSLLFGILCHSMHGIMLSVISFLPPPSKVELTPKLLYTFTLEGSYLGPYLIVVLLFWIASLTIICIEGKNLAYKGNSYLNILTLRR